MTVGVDDQQQASLGALIWIFGMAPTVAPQEVLDDTPLPRGRECLNLFVTLARTDVSDVELELAGTCLALQAECRERQFDALELVLSHMDAGRLVWPRDDDAFLAVAAAVYELGWQDELINDRRP